MAKIIEIQDTPTTRTIVACLAANCADDAQHVEEYHRSWTWGLDTSMTEADMIREVKLLIKSAIGPKSSPTIRKVSIKV